MYTGVLLSYIGIGANLLHLSYIHEIAKKHGLLDSGFRLVTNNGRDANQEVPHFHIHILGGENLKGIK